MVGFLQNAFELVRDKIKQAQNANCKDANKKWREPNFSVGDMVWLSTTNLKSHRSSHKLDYLQRGPFKILSMKGISYELELPTSWRIHPVFHGSLLRKAANNPWPGQLEKSPSPVNIIGDNEYEILRSKSSKVMASKHFTQAQWVDHEDNNWYPASDFMYAPHLIKRYHQDHKTRKGPPLELENWIRAYESGRDNYEELRNNEL